MGVERRSGGAFPCADGRSTDGMNRVGDPAWGFWNDRTTGAPGGGAAADGPTLDGGVDEFVPLSPGSGRGRGSG
jgi:hypothetical protein